MSPKPSFDRAVYILLGFVLIVIVLKHLAIILQPLLIAAFLGYFFLPLRDYLRKKHLPPLVVDVVLLVVILSLLLTLGWLTTSSLNKLIERFPVYREQMGVFRDHARATIDHLPNYWRVRLENFRLPWDWVGQTLGSFVGSFLSFLAMDLVVLVFFVFLLLEARRFPDRLAQAYGSERARRIWHLVEKINKSILAYIKVKALISLLVASLSAVAMASFAVDIWPFWVLVTFFGNFVPYFGSIAAIVFPVLILLMQTGHLGEPLLMLGILTLIQRVVEVALEPKLTGTVLNLSPLLLLVWLAFWAWLWGIVGMILAVPILVSLKVILEHIPATAPLASLMGERARPN